MHTEKIYTEYKKFNAKKVFYILIFIIILGIIALGALLHGPSSLGFKNSFAALFKETGIARAIVWELRLPRIIMAILTGCGLSIAGTVFQAILKNPLASPYTLGIASGAGFGAVLAIVFGGSFYSEYLIAGSSFFFAMLSSTIILSIAKLKDPSPETMILAGIAIMFLFSSLSSFFQYIGTMEQVQEIVFWFFGSLSKTGWKEIGIVSVMIFVPMPFLIKSSWQLNLLATGDESARALGVNTTKLRMQGMVFASLITSACICFTGVIGFVGLVSPHIGRMLVGSDHRFLIPTSALIGTILVLVADTFGRVLWAPQVIPIGIVTSFIGVPFFFYLLIRRTRGYW
ncbi:MAG: iron ABC transporter permease [Desulfobacteraceae bacterium]|nr:iron ABC transporter permease [Desulfobacteraceae bacterium]